MLGNLCRWTVYSVIGCVALFLFVDTLYWTWVEAQFMIEKREEGRYLPNPSMPSPPLPHGSLFPQTPSLPSPIWVYSGFFDAQGITFLLDLPTHEPYTILSCGYGNYRGVVRGVYPGNDAQRIQQYFGGDWRAGGAYSHLLHHLQCQVALPSNITSLPGYIEIMIKGKSYRGISQLPIQSPYAASGGLIVGISAVLYGSQTHTKLSEWLVHHLDGVGIDHMVLYVDAAEWIDEKAVNILASPRVTVIYWNHPSPTHHHWHLRMRYGKANVFYHGQSAALADAAIRFGGAFAYSLTIDIDEWLQWSNHTMPLPTILSMEYPTLLGITFRRIRPSGKEDLPGKMICNLREVACLGVHKCYFHDYSMEDIYYAIRDRWWSTNHATFTLLILSSLPFLILSILHQPTTPLYLPLYLTIVGISIALRLHMMPVAYEGFCRDCITPTLTEGFYKHTRHIG